MVNRPTLVKIFSMRPNSSPCCVANTDP